MAGRAATSALLKLDCKSQLITLHSRGSVVFPLPFSPVQPEVRAIAFQKAKSSKKAVVCGSCIDACAQHWSEWVLRVSVQQLGQVRRLLAAYV